MSAWNYITHDFTTCTSTMCDPESDDLRLVYTTLTPQCHVKNLQAIAL